MLKNQLSQSLSSVHAQTNKKQFGDVVCSTFWHIPGRRLPTFVRPKDETAAGKDVALALVWRPIRALHSLITDKSRSDPPWDATPTRGVRVFTTHQRKPALSSATALRSLSARPFGSDKGEVRHANEAEVGSPAGGTRGRKSVHSGARRSSFSGGPTVRILDLGRSCQLNV